MSIRVSCKTQDEVDYLWCNLSEGGEEGPCGWLKDKYGVSWQIILTALGELISDPDAAKSQEAMKAMLGMGKIDIEALQRAVSQP
ncbi:MAG: VOC family protein [Pseudonocardiaceae bacterium]